MRKILLTIILGIFLISFISACGEAVKAGDPTRLIFQSNETQLNITVEYVNQSGFWVDNSPMVQSGKTFFIDFNETDEVGLLRYFACDDIGNCDYTCDKEITPTGKLLTEANSKLLIGSFIILIVTTIFFLVFGIFTQNRPFKIFFVSLSALLMVGTLGFSVSVFQQMFGTLGNIVETYGRVFILLTTLIIGGGIGLFVYVVYMSIISFWNNSRGLNEDDDDDDD